MAYGDDVAALPALHRQAAARHVSVGSAARYADSLSGAPATRGRRLKTLKSLLSFATRMGCAPHRHPTPTPAWSNQRGSSPAPLQKKKRRRTRDWTIAPTPIPPETPPTPNWSPCGCTARVPTPSATLGPRSPAGIISRSDLQNDSDLQAHVSEKRVADQRPRLRHATVFENAPLLGYSRLSFAAGDAQLRPVSSAVTILDDLVAHFDRSD
jgi:hypothetical protein